MGTRYSSLSVSGYNSSPPSDDGSTAASNQVKWSTIKTKLADPLNTFAAAVNSALVTALDQSVRVVTANDSAADTDHDKTIVIGSTVTAAVTVSLADAATMAAGYVVTVANQSNVACTVGRATASNTINGATSDYTLPAYHSITFVVASPATGYIIKDSNLGRQSNGGASLPAGTAAAPALSAAGDSNTGTYFPAADTWAVATGGTERVRVDSAGNLGLGVTPKTWTNYTAFELGPMSLMAAGNVESVVVANAYYNSGWKYKNSAAATYYSQDAGAHAWATAGSGTAGNAITFTTAMTLDVNGKLSTASSYNGVAAAISNTNTGLTAGVLEVSSGTASGTGFQLINGYNSGGLCFRVRGNGDVNNTNNTYGSISDRKLKENITDATPKLEKLCQVRVVNYNLIGDTLKQIGVVAQELEQVFPGMVDETVDRDSDGNDLGTTTKSVKYSVFVPMLIKGLQELKAEFDAYKAAHP